MATQLTALTVKKMKPRATAFYVSDTKIRGLQLRTAPDGSQTWSVRFRIGRQQKRLTLGDAKVIPLGDDKDDKGKKIDGARSLAREALHKVKNGTDPAEAKREGRDADTVGDFAKTYIEKHAKAKKRTWKDDQRQLDRDVLPAWRNKPMKEITRRDVRELLDTIAERAPIMANRTRSLLHKMWNVAITLDVVESNVVTATDKPGEEQQRDRVLGHDEIRRLWKACDALPLEMAATFRLRLVTAQRGGEVIDMPWSEVDLASRWWTIAAERSKNGLAHRVPLSAPALAILTALKAQEDRRLKTQKDAKRSPFVLAGARGKRQQAEAAATLGIENFRGHDLRRTAASLMAGAGVQRLVISKILNHVETGVTAVYDRHGYDAEKRIALDDWGRVLTGILRKKDKTNVVAFARA
jgi:integrase